MDDELMYTTSIMMINKNYSFCSLKLLNDKFKDCWLEPTNRNLVTFAERNNLHIISIIILPVKMIAGLDISEVLALLFSCDNSSLGFTRKSLN